MRDPGKPAVLGLGEELRGEGAERFLRSVDPKCMEAADRARSRTDGLFKRPMLVVRGRGEQAHEALLVVNGDPSDDIDRQRLIEWEERIPDRPENLRLLLY